MQRPISQIAAPVDGGILVFRLLLVVSLAAAFAQITLGAFVRAADAGLACDNSWPLCQGQWIPPFTGDVILEYTHRLTAVLLGFFVLAAAVYAWRLYRNNKVVFRFTLAALVLVIAAGAFGGATVISELGWGLRLIHLAIAEAVIAALMVALVGVWPVTNAGVNTPSSGQMTGGGLVMSLMIVSTFAVLISGSIVVGQGASTACGSWPMCSGSQFIPSGDAKFAIHMAHRIVAAVAGLLMIVSAAWTWRMREWWPGAGVAAVVLVVFLVGQIFLGAANPWSSFAPGWKAIHLMAATATWLAATALVSLVYVPRLSANDGPDTSVERFSGLRSLMQ